MADYAHLQNGSDIRGVALDGVPGEAVNLTEQAARDLGAAFAVWLADKKKKATGALTVAVGRDSRLSGPSLLAAVSAGLRGAGVTVYDCAMASTPAMFMSTVLPGHGYDGAIMITASHLPFNRNGLKFFISDGGLEHEDIEALVELAAGELPSGGDGGCRQVDLISDYAAHLVEKIRAGIGGGEQPLSGFKIAVDAGNGAGGFFATKVLAVLGADISASQYLEPDGSFPNHIPNPENEQAMEAIIRATVENGCDLGLIFDTDVDRAGAVDAGGHEINRNRLIALLAAIVLEDCPGGTIVTDSVTSSHLAAFITDELHGVHRRFKRGYKNVINEAIRLEKTGVAAPLAIETSGHGALKENYYLDDGAYLCAKILIKAAKLRAEGKTIDSMLADLKEPAETAELRFKIELDDFAPYGKQVLCDLEQYVNTQPGWQMAADNFEGIRVNFTEAGQRGWFLLRMSLHDPILPLNIESDDVGGAKKIARQVYDFIKGYDKLDLSPLERYIR
ncbi:phosphomannomutase/phosphoglucomutase [Neobittarella massiliensis]|uniref:phosphomannomutase/phosphoglucomutase n=1 Tax=Neobittarella massiliensis (ex Bilen et al. 2018) TaxID=2041842 RepID=UPI000CF6F9D5|nr:phosphomannomutase/phosphoglucomutase [Neobittarella massiliensis]